MPTFVEFTVADSLGNTSPLRIQITDETIPSAVDTYITGVIAAIWPTGGAPEISLGNVINTKFIVEGSLYNTAVVANSDIRQNFKMRCKSATAGDNWDFGIPARNDDPELIAPGSKRLAALGTTPWNNVQAAIIGAGTIHALSPETLAVMTGFVKGTANVGERVLPREGSGSR